MLLKKFLPLLGLLAAAGCGGGGSDTPSSPTPQAQIQLMTSGLSGTVSISAAGTTSVVAENGSRVLLTLPQGSTFSIAVATQPDGQRCTLSNGSGTAIAPAVSVSLSCAHLLEASSVPAEPGAIASVAAPSSATRELLALSGNVGGTPLTSVRLLGGRISYVVPALAPGTYTLSLSLERQRYEHDFTVGATSAEAPSVTVSDLANKLDTLAANARADGTSEGAQLATEMESASLALRLEFSRVDAVAQQRSAAMIRSILLQYAAAEASGISDGRAYALRDRSWPLFTIDSCTIIGVRFAAKIVTVVGLIAGVALDPSPIDKAIFAALIAVVKPSMGRAYNRILGDNCFNIEKITGVSAGPSASSGREFKTSASTLARINQYHSSAPNVAANATAVRRALSVGQQTFGAEEAKTLNVQVDVTISGTVGTLLSGLQYGLDRVEVILPNDAVSWLRQLLPARSVALNLAGFEVTSISAPTVELVSASNSKTGKALRFKNRDAGTGDDIPFQFTLTDPQAREIVVDAVLKPKLCPTYIPVSASFPKFSPVYEEWSDDLGLTWRSLETWNYHIIDPLHLLERAGLASSIALKICEGTDEGILSGSFSDPPVSPSQVQNDYFVEVVNGEVRITQHMFANAADPGGWAGRTMLSFRHDLRHTVTYSVRTGFFTHTAVGETRATFRHPGGRIETDLSRIYGSSTGSVAVDIR